MHIVISVSCDNGNNGVWCLYFGIINFICNSLFECVEFCFGTKAYPASILLFSKRNFAIDKNWIVSNWHTDC